MYLSRSFVLILCSSVKGGKKKKKKCSSKLTYLQTFHRLYNYNNMSRSAYKVKYGTAKYSPRGQPSSTSNSRSCSQTNYSSSSSPSVSQIGTDDVTKEGDGESDWNNVQSPSKWPGTAGIALSACMTPVSTPMSRVDGANSIEDEKRRAAATEARRRRRLVLTRRQNSNSPRRNTVRCCCCCCCCQLKKKSLCSFA